MRFSSCGNSFSDLPEKRKAILKQLKYCAKLVQSELIFHSNLFLFPVHVSGLFGDNI